MLLLALVAAALVAGTAWRLAAPEPAPSAAAPARAARAPAGRVVRHIEIPPGWRLEQIAEALDRSGIGDGDRFLELARARSLEGYLYPGVYDVRPGFSEARLVGEMHGEFREGFDKAMRLRAERLGLSVHEVVTLASIVEREMVFASEAPAIAAVYLNRLRAGMRLQADPTVIYALDSRAPGRRYWDRRVLYRDLRIESPYNSYAHRGLPPGPIASPTREAMLAVLYPADVDYRFFVARGNGTHAFARTGRAHAANVERYRPGRPRPKPPRTLLQRMVERLTAPIDGHVGIVVHNLATGEHAGVREDEFFTAASLYKLAVMVTAFEEREAGRLSFDTVLPIPESAAVEDYVELRGRLGRRPTVRKAIEEMIVVSSNAAGITLLRRFGRNKVDRVLRRYGLRDTSLSSRRIVTTPRDIGHLLALLAHGRVVSPRASAQMRAVLLRQEINDRLPKYLPPHAKLAHKTGTLDFPSHDAGILWTRSGPVVIAAVTEDVTNRAAATETVAQLGRLVYDYFEGYAPTAARISARGNPACRHGAFPPRRHGPLAGRTIALDPAHGGSRPGTIFRFADGAVLAEEDVALDVSFLLRDLLTARGAKVVLTRCRDASLSLLGRAVVANAARPDLVVSIGVAGSRRPDRDGVEIAHYLPDGKILANHLLGTFAKPALWETLSAANALPNRGVARRRTPLLVHTLAPTVVTESLYLTNPAEARLLRRGDRIRQIAAGHLRGILGYFGVPQPTRTRAQAQPYKHRRRPAPRGGPVRIVAVGDIALAQTPRLPLDGRGVFARVAPALAGDVVLGNLEGTLSWGGTSKCAHGRGTACFAFRAPPSTAHSLRRAGFTVLNLANNHSGDFGLQGEAETLAALDSAGLAHTGRPGQVTRTEIGGVRVAIVGFAPYSRTQNLLDVDGARRLVRRADGWADVVVVTMHAGAEGTDSTHVRSCTETYVGESRGDPVAFAHAVVDAGADLVVGHGPHVMRGIEWYRGRAIAYSLGNFAANATFGIEGLLGAGGILQATLAADGSWQRGRLLSVRLRNGSTVPDPGRTAARLTRALSGEDFGARAVRVLGDGTLAPPRTSSGELAARELPALVCRADTGGRRLVALSFDDGPSRHTPAVLRLLRRNGARATFFVVGERVAGREAILRRVLREGHELGNHTYTHPHTGELSESALRRELARTSAAVKAATGRALRLVRPPFGEDMERLARVGFELGLRPTVMWAVDPDDRPSASPERIAHDLLAHVQPGAIVVMHDGRSHDGATVRALPRILVELRRRGYRMVTVSELLAAHTRASASALQVQSLTPRMKAELLVVSGLPAPHGVGGVLVQRWSRNRIRPGGALVFADQEGGRVRALPELPPRRAARSYATPSQAAAAAQATGGALAATGVDVDLAPVLDAADGPLGERHFQRPRIALAFARGLAERGVEPCAKHFPGLGSTRRSTDLGATRGAVRARELAAFRAAIRARVQCIMVSHARYRRLGRGPASLEPAAYRLLRRLGFDGIALTDDLDVLGADRTAQSARRAIRAGADMVLFTDPRNAARAIDALVPLAKQGLLDAHVARVLAFRAELRKGASRVRG